MTIFRKSIISTACGFVLTMGLVVILVIVTGPLASIFSPSIQKNIPWLIFIFSLLIIAPLVSRKLYRIDGIKKILGWTFIGTGAEFLVFPLLLMFVVKSASSPSGILVITTLFVLSLFIGLLAGFINIAVGVLLIKSDNIIRSAMGERRHERRR